METTENKSPITGTEGAEIELNVAAEWTKNHRHRHPGGSISQFFGAEILQQMLQQPGCKGLRMYYANSKPLNGWQRFVLGLARVLANTEGEKHLILAGATSEGHDQLPEDGKMEIATPNVSAGTVSAHVIAPKIAGRVILGEQAMPCPGSSGCPQNQLTQ